jgi:hypothetical protein
MNTSANFLSRTLSIAIALAASIVSAASPRLTDQRLQLRLFAESPDLVTPIGMAIDGDDNVFVIESHTHQPPDNYAGPSTDRISVQDGLSIVDALSSGVIVDPLVRHAAVMRLAGEEMAAARAKCLQGDASLRMIGLLACKRAKPADADRITKFLSDSDPEIRRAALMWAAESMDLGLADQLSKTLEIQPVTPQVFETYLAACEVLTPEFKEAYRSAEKVKANAIARKLAAGVIIDVAALASIKGCDPARLESLTEDASKQVAVQATRPIMELSASSPLHSKRPRSNEDWHSALVSGGDPLLGRHVFYSKRVGCSKCQQMDGRGGTLGPGQNGIARSKTRKQIIDSILEPSAEFPPQYQT